MALVIKDRVKETTTTTGTGTITLAGASTGYQSFSVIGNGNTTYYAIVGGSEWEVGIGTYTSSGTTLARTTVLESSNSNNLVNFSAGTKDVFVTYPASIASTNVIGPSSADNNAIAVFDGTTGKLIQNGQANIDPLTGTINTDGEVQASSYGVNNTSSSALSRPFGDSNSISNDYAYALGQSNNCSGIRTYAIGKSNTVSGNSSMAIGHSASATGDYSYALGESASAPGYASYAIGPYGTADGSYTFAFGESSVTYGYSNYVFGYGSTIYSDYSYAFGEANILDGYLTYAVGYSNNTSSNSNYAHVFGHNNTISNASDHVYAIGGGNGLGTLSAAATYSVAIGNDNVIDTANYSYAIGYDNDVSGDYNVAIGSFNNATGTSAVALGTGANTRNLYGAFAYSTGAVFNTFGDSQTVLYIAKATTSTNTPEVMTFDGQVATTVNQVILPNNSTYFFSIHLVARRSDADNESAAYKIEGCIDRNANAASTALVGTPVKTILSEDSTAWDVSVSADTTNGGLAITVTGENSKTIYWVAKIDTVQVIG